jgi:hypothetical protein
VTGEIEHFENCPREPKRVEEYTLTKPLIRKGTAANGEKDRIVGYQKRRVVRCDECGAGAVFDSADGRLLARHS